MRFNKLKDTRYEEYNFIELVEIPIKKYQYLIKS
jgi:hypothetical protein